MHALASCRMRAQTLCGNCHCVLRTIPSIRIRVHPIIVVQSQIGTTDSGEFLRLARKTRRRLIVILIPSSIYSEHSAGISYTDVHQIEIKIKTMHNHFELCQFETMKEVLLQAGRIRCIASLQKRVREVFPYRIASYYNFFYNGLKPSLIAIQL